LDCVKKLLSEVLTGMATINAHTVAYHQQNSHIFAG